MTTLVTYTGDGSTTDWTFPFDYLADDYVTFTILDAGNQDVSVNYTGELVSVSEMRITPAADSGYTVRIQRATAVQDDLFGFGAGGVMRPSDIAFAMKSVRDFSEEMSGVASTTIIDVADAAIDTAIAAAQAAQAAAELAETNAATSETNAATSETNADTSETNAAASAAAAATSETNLGVSEANAAASASAAATSETNAASSATAAAASAGLAGTSASNAATSEANAATSESNASAAEAAASTLAAAALASEVAATLAQGAAAGSATAAAGSASSAASSASAASTSETNAASSASTAQTAATNAQNALNSLNNRYLGAHASDSAVATYISNDSNITLDEGDLYFNTTDNKLKYYTTGSGWLPAAATNVINMTSLGVAGDVTITSATTGDILRWNGTQWVNYPDSNYATSTQGGLADTAVQPGDLATVATSGSYNDLSNQPTLGTAAAAATADFATAAQGALADSATQPGDLAAVATSGAYSDLTGAPTFGNIPQNSQTAAYILVAGDAGKHISITSGGVTVNTSVFSTGDAVTIFNNSGSDQTITQGTSVTLYLAGDGTTGNKTLAGYGLSTLLCVGTDTFVISGVGLS